MGYLLKEALKTLCGVNQWAYAVLWKIGYQNPKLLIWEECYFDSTSFPWLPGVSGNGDPEIAFQGFNASFVSTKSCNLLSTVQGGDKVKLLVNKMMADSHVNIVGEGLVGRVGFTGSHHWILSETYQGEVYPSKVLEEVCQQFSAGMKTIAVIPVLPHGVIQFGSHLTITENMGFVNYVTSLLCQLGEVSGALLSDSYTSKEASPKLSISVCLRNSALNGNLSLESDVTDSSSLMAGAFNHAGSSLYNSLLHNQVSFPLTSEIQNDLSSAVAFQSLKSSPGPLQSSNYNQKTDFSTAVKFDLPSTSGLINGGVKAEVISPHSTKWSTLSFPSCGSHSLTCCSMRCIPQSDEGSHPPVRVPNFTGFNRMSDPRSYSLLNSRTLPPVVVNELNKGEHQNMEAMSSTCAVSDEKMAVNENVAFKCLNLNVLENLYLPKPKTSITNSVDHLTANFSHAYFSASQLQGMEKRITQSEIYGCDAVEHHIPQVHDSSASRIVRDQSLVSLIPSFGEDGTKQKFGDLCQSMKITGNDDSFAQPQSGDDLFDILGADFKNKLLKNCWNSGLDDNSSLNDDSEAYSFPYSKKLPTFEPLTTNQENATGGIFSTDTDHLLDSVVSNVHPTVSQSVDDSASCRTTLTNISIPSVPNVSLPRKYGVSDKMEELFNIPKYLANPGLVSSCSLKSTLSKEDSESYSPSTSVYEPQKNTWIEEGTQNMKLSNCSSTECSKKLNESSKITRKRLIPGENPKPRPKDRQMIQDRVKELREIVPNGAKCSIDALLERTIKHMLFLQSVTKHADKLKETGQSKMISNDGSLPSKDIFEGGTTWAYEVGSHSMVCPIIVEDLNQPRQLLVEMLCEERGTFLEIADIIRGLGLSILKGVMETWHDKIWSRFVVEANRDVTRMEIFLSLVRLLERSSKPSDPHVSNASQVKRMVQQFQQAPPLPATGVSHNLH